MLYIKKWVWYNPVRKKAAVLKVEDRGYGAFLISIRISADRRPAAGNREAGEGFWGGKPVWNAGGRYRFGQDIYNGKYYWAGAEADTHYFA